MASITTLYSCSQWRTSKSSNVIDLLKTPGVAKDLRNFEVSTEGGYRRINGYQKFGTTNATRPTGSATNILRHVSIC